MLRKIRRHAKLKIVGIVIYDFIFFQSVLDMFRNRVAKG